MLSPEVFNEIKEWVNKNVSYSMSSYYFSEEYKETCLKFFKTLQEKHLPNNSYVKLFITSYPDDYNHRWQVFFCTSEEYFNQLHKQGYHMEWKTNTLQGLWGHFLMFTKRNVIKLEVESNITGDIIALWENETHIL
jgi:hypothetical protein